MRYIRMYKNKNKVKYTKQIEDSVVVDYDENDKVVGIEILHEHIFVEKSGEIYLAEKKLIDELFIENDSLREKATRNRGFDEIKSEVAEFMKKCLEMSRKISDVDLRDNLRQAIWFWQQMAFRDEYCSPIILKEYEHNET